MNKYTYILVYYALTQRCLIRTYWTNFLPQVPLPFGNEKIEKVDVNFSTHQKWHKNW
jgi:hypothetical protein